MSVFGTAVCSLISIGLLFQKPQSAKTVIVLSNQGSLTEEHRRILEKWHTNLTRSGTVSNFRTSTLQIRAVAVLSGLAAALGAFHVGAWNFSFPSEIDRSIWRITSVISCVIGPFYCAIAMYSLLRPVFKTLASRPIFSASGTTDFSPRFISNMKIALAFYVVLRALLIVEMVRFLVYIPPDAYITIWADSLPHV